VAPNITEAPADRTVVEPNSVQFDCVAEGFPRPMITWYIRQNGNITEISDTIDFNITTTIGAGDRQVMSSLRVNQVRPSLAADYICNASNVVDDDTETATLTVHSKSKQPCCTKLNIICFLIY